MPIYNWDLDQAAIVSDLQLQATLKLGVKVRDEPLLLEGWIEHHAKIVGLENLIIADNGSTDTVTSEIYGKYSDSCTIFRFGGPHNEIHWHPRFLRLFEAVRSSCRYFSFVDVDERLIWADNDSWLADGSIIEMIEQKVFEGILPTTWLINTLNSFDTFNLLDSEDRPIFENNLRWGKPIMPAELVGRQTGIHNAQFNRYGFSKALGCHLFLLHLTQFPERRISASRNKILSRGVIDPNTTNEVIMSMNFDNHQDKTLSRFVEDMKKMHRIMVGEQQNSGVISDCHFRLQETGRIYFSNEKCRIRLSNFLADGPNLIRSLLGTGEFEDGFRSDGPSLLEEAIALRNNGHGRRAEILFRHGMARYPGFLDRFGHPAFRKELLRTFLARQEWTEAERLLLNEKNGEQEVWHRTLFARAYSQSGDEPNAIKWWKLVLDDDPTNGEAKAALT